MNTKNILASVLSICFTLMVACWGMHFPGMIAVSANADTFPINCTPTPIPVPPTDPSPTPPKTYASPADYDLTHPELEILPQDYQNPNRAQMAWIQYGGNYNYRKPGVIMIHPTNWNGGRAEDIAGKAREIALTNKFFVASVYYELAPNDTAAEGYIPGQPSHEFDGTGVGWLMKLEVDDIKNYIKAMRADPRCRADGWVAVVGGSAGATHAITVALDTNPSGPNGTDWPHWMQYGDDRPNCAVMLSTIYDFADLTPPTGRPGTDPKYLHLGISNYAQIPSPISISALASLDLNPVNLIAGAISAERGFVPIYMFNSYGDNPTAYHQLVNMICRLESAGLTLGTDYKYLTLPGSDHAYQLWDNLIPGQDKTVGDEVIDFLEAQAGVQ